MSGVTIDHSSLLTSRGVPSTRPESRASRLVSTIAYDEGDQALAIHTAARSSIAAAPQARRTRRLRAGAVSVIAAASIASGESPPGSDGSPARAAAPNPSALGACGREGVAI